MRIAKTLLDVNPKANIQILDANSSIGGTWCKSRLYPNLRIQSVREHVEFSEFPMMPEDTIDGTYISGRQIYDYLDRFAKLYGLYERIRLNTKVVNIQRADTSIGTGNGGRVLDVETLENGNVMDIHPQGESEIKQSIATRITFDKLIMATGLCGRPYLPPFPTQDLRADIIHAQELGENYQQLDSSTITSVTIIGGGKSAFDAVYLALQKGKRVDWVIPKDGTGPTALYPLHLMNVPLLNSIKLSVTRFVTSLSPCVTTLEMKNGLTWWGRFLHTSILGRFIVSLIFRLLTWMCAWDAGFTKSENSAKLRPNVDRYVPSTRREK